MSTPVLHILLDTNTLLHFKRPDLLDWKHIVQGQEVALLVCPALIDELEAIKIDLKRPGKLRERAHKAIMWLSEKMDLPEPIQLTPDVRLIFITESPTIDFRAHRLSYTVPDDQLIASGIQFRDQTGSTVSFFSNDTGLRLKLRSRGLTGFTLPESERLPDEPDEESKKIKTLETRLASFENRQPKPILTFVDGSTHAKVKLKAIDRPEPAQSFFDYKISRGELERYGNKHTTYQDKHRAWASQAALRFPVQLILTNAGSAVATDILLTLTFPDFITALPDRAVLSKPKAPKPPANPLLGLDLRSPSLPVFSPPVTPYIPRPTDAHIHTNHNTVTFRIPSFVQGRTLNLDPFVLMFDSETDVQNHSIEYSMSLVEHPEGISGSLHIILSDDNVEHGN